MPATVLVVHDEQQNTRELAVLALRAVHLEAVGFDDPMKALDAIEASFRVRVLVTRVMFAPGKPNGVALARMVRVKRPGTKVVLIGIGGRLTAPPLPHHRAYGSRTTAVR